MGKDKTQLGKLFESGIGLWIDLITAISRENKSVVSVLDLKKKKEKESPFDASMPIDNPDIKVVEGRYKGKPFVIGVGVSTQRETKGVGEISIPTGGKVGYATQKDLQWQLFYNMGALPSGFVPAEKVLGFMAGTVTLASGSFAALSGETKFIETSEEKLEAYKGQDDPRKFLITKPTKDYKKEEKKSEK